MLPASTAVPWLLVVVCFASQDTGRALPSSDCVSNTFDCTAILLLFCAFVYRLWLALSWLLGSVVGFQAVKDGLLQEAFQQVQEF